MVAPTAAIAKRTPPTTIAAATGSPSMRSAGSGGERLIRLDRLRASFSAFGGGWDATWTEWGAAPRGTGPGSGAAASALSQRVQRRPSHQRKVLILASANQPAPSATRAG